MRLDYKRFLRNKYDENSGTRIRPTDGSAGADGASSAGVGPEVKVTRSGEQL